MKISAKTMSILKNFASINSHLFVKAGSKLSTMAIAKNIVAEVDVEEVFPHEFGIFNLQEFLSVMGLMASPNVEFGTKYMTISEDNVSLRYVYSDASILTYPTKSIKLPTEDVSFQINSTQLAQLQKAASALSVQDVAFVGTDGGISAMVVDKENDSSNNYVVNLDATTDKEFKCFFKNENFKLMADTYDVVLCDKNISRFTGKTTGAVYHIAVESDSKFS